jgi:alpha-tubulin suppressor-like RCC1 family protein
MVTQPAIVVNTVDQRARVGTVLATSKGQWTGYPIPEVNYSYWYRCDTPNLSITYTQPTSCSAIPGSNGINGETYLITPSDVGHYLLFSVIATNSQGVVQVFTPTTVEASNAPASYDAPVISGDVGQGNTLTVSNGQWTSYPSRLTYTYQWYHCDSASPALLAGVPVGCSADLNGSSATYTQSVADTGHYVVAVVTATNSGGDRGYSLAAGVGLVANTPTATVTPAITGTLVLGSVLSVDSGTWVAYPASTGASQQWYRCTTQPAPDVTHVPNDCTIISGETNNAYTLSVDDVGSYVAVRTTKTNANGDGFTFSISNGRVTRPPSNTVAPSLSGSALLNGGLTLSNGTWVGYPTPTYAYAWYRCSTSTPLTVSDVPTGCTLLTGRTASTYTVTSSDLGYYVFGVVTATNSVSSASVSATALDVSQSAPVLVTAPTVSGTRVTGSVLTASVGSWTESPTGASTWQWYDCTATVDSPASTIPGTCSPIDGATSSTYTQVAADAGQYVTVATTRTNSLGSVVSLAVETSVTNRPPTNTVAPSLSGSALLNGVLTVSTGTWVGYPTPTYTYQWYRCSSASPSVVSGVPSGCTLLTGQISLTYTVTSADLGYYVFGVVTATNSAGTVSLTANSVAQSQSIPALALDGAPGVSGTRVTGNVLTVSAGSWTGFPSGLSTWQWYDCSDPIPVPRSAIPGTCSAISGATSSTYTQVAADAGLYVTVVTTRTNSQGSAVSVASAASVTISPPINTVGPALSGSALLNGVLTVGTGTWVGYPTPTFGYSWWRCSISTPLVLSGVPTGCIYVRGSSLTYTVTSADVGLYIIAIVTATNSFATVSSTANSLAQSQSIPALALYGAPTVSGARVTGNVLTASAGSWTESPTGTSSWQWYDCSATVAPATSTIPGTCSAIDGATDSTYTQVVTDVGEYVTVATTRTNSLGSVVSLAAVTSVTDQPPTNSVSPSLSGDVSLGGVLYAQAGTWLGSPFPSLSYSWFDCPTSSPTMVHGVPSGCTLRSYADSYTVFARDLGSYVVLVVTGSNRASTTYAMAPVLGQSQSSPVFASAPSVSGAQIEGSTLTASSASWTEYPVGSSSWQWYDCSEPIAARLTNVPGTCSTIPGASGPTYTQTSSDVGSYVLAVETRTNSLGVVSDSAGIVVQTASLPRSTTSPALSGVGIGNFVTLAGDVWSGTPAPSKSYQWFKCASPVIAASITQPQDCGINVGAPKVAAGSMFTCATFADGALSCWGEPANSVSPFTETGKFLSVSTGAYHACAVVLGGTVKCLGSNSSGQLGIALTTTSAASPTAVPGLTGVKAVSAGATSTCALKMDQTIWCWGGNVSGQLGNGSSVDSVVPVRVSGVTNAVSVAALWDSFCAVTSTGTILCWGANGYGQLGNGTTTPSNVPVVVSGISTATAVSANIGSNVCALLADGTVKCWGAGNYGDLGNGRNANQSIPVSVTGLGGVASLGVGFQNACAVGTNGYVECWGNGNGALTESWTPQVVPSVSNAVAVSSGRGHSCAVLNDDSVLCWGSNVVGQLGNGSTSPYPALGVKASVRPTPSTYLISPSELGSNLIGIVTGSNWAGSSKVWTASTAISSGPQLVDSPVVSGVRQVGQALSVGAGGFYEYPTATSTWQWYDCTATVASATSTIPGTCSAISGATASTYTQVAADAGLYVTVATTRTNSLGSVVSLAAVTSVTNRLPTNTVAPSLSGSALLNGVLTVSTGTWVGYPTPTYTYQWYRCSSASPSVVSGVPSGCTVLTYQISSTYTVTSADLGYYVFGVVTASNSVSTVSVTATALDVSQSAPVVSTAPSLSGRYETGNVLTVSAGSWAEYPIGTSTWQWYNCTATVASATSTIPGTCSAISGATSSTYTQVAADAGLYVTVATSRTNALGSVVSLAAATSVTVQQPTMMVAPSLSGSASFSGVLTRSVGTWTGYPTPSYAYAWYRCPSASPSVVSGVPTGCTLLTGQTSSTYTVTASDLGSYVFSFLTVSNVLSSWRGYDQLGKSQSAPVLVTAPTVSGSRTAGVSYSTLTASSGSWTEYPTGTSTWQWYDCSATVSSATSTIPETCSAISGATSSTYTQVAADAGQYVTVATTRTNSQGSLITLSAATLPTNLAPAVTVAPTLTTSALSGGYVTASSGTWQGFPTPKLTYSWYRCSSVVPTPGTSSPGCTLASDVHAIENGYDFACALLDDRTVSCWGANESGQLGDGTTTNRSMPVPVAGLDGVIQIASNPEASSMCALLATGVVSCWGLNTYGQLGDGTKVSSSTPVVVSGISTATQVSLGPHSACAVLQSGKINCWGSGGSGRLGNGSNSESLIPVEVSGISNATSVSARGTGHVCALLQDGTVKCWGANLSGQLGNASFTTSYTPVSVTGVASAVDVSIGGSSSCAVLASGSVKCWGYGLQDTYGSVHSIPFTQAGISNAATISVGGAFACARTADSTLMCWGTGSNGQTGSWGNYQVLPNDMGLNGVESFSTSTNNGCASTNDHAVFCWGLNGGILSSSTDTTRVLAQPTVISLPTSLTTRYLWGLDAATHFVVNVMGVNSFGGAHIYSASN